MSRGWTARNPITGAWLQTKPATDSYRDGYDAIFGKKPELMPVAKPWPELSEEDIKKLSDSMSHRNEGAID